MSSGVLCAVILCVLCVVAGGYGWFWAGYEWYWVVIRGYLWLFVVIGG